MAKYTIELRDVAKHYPLFSFPYPFYDEKKRKEFEQSFVRHFYFREICCPSVEQFLFYLEDKMNIVFPYYNELMRTAQIEYDVENPYKLTETYTRSIDRQDKMHGVFSGVDQLQRSESGQTDTENETNRNESQTGTGKDVSIDSGTAKTVKAETVDSESSRNANTTGSGNTTDIEKFLDTPQGLTDLSESDYLTNLTRKNGTNSSEQDVTESGTGKTETDGTTTTTDERNGTVSRETKNDVEGKETATGKTSVQAESEQKATQDSNTRSENVGKQLETYTMTRKGNIGVNPASHEIDCHINTQRTLKRIEEMFFNECEDLFMMVY